MIVKSEQKRSYWIASLQRRWHSFLVDLVDMDNVVTKALDQHGLRTNNENLIDVGEIICILLTIFEKVEKKRKDAISVLQCVDMTLNWLLNVYIGTMLLVYFLLVSMESQTNIYSLRTYKDGVSIVE